MKLCGIYALYYLDEGLVYVGQAQNIQKRYTEHLNSLKRNKHANFKLKKAYDTYGTPKLHILEECDIDELHDKEKMWTAEFDSINSGLNIVEAGVSGWGINSSQSKYTKIAVLKVFSLLTTTNLANIDISKKIKVSLRLVESIRNGYSHTWLKEAYPERYKLLKNKTKVKNTVSRKYKTKIILTHTESNKEEAIESVVDFAKKYAQSANYTAFASGIRRVIRKEQSSYCGWKLKV